MPWILEEYTRLAARDLDASVACLSLVDPERRLVTDSFGLSATSALLISWPFMKRVAASGRPLIVSDGRQDPATAGHPAVRDGTVTAYMGVPLVNADGATVGTLSVMDRKPREWSVRQFRYLQRLAAGIVQALDGEQQFPEDAPWAEDARERTRHVPVRRVRRRTAYAGLAAPLTPSGQDV